MSWFADRETPAASRNAIADGRAHTLAQLAPRPVFVENLDRKSCTMRGDDGHWYREVDTNLWVRGDEEPACVAYLSVGRHGGSIGLKPMFFLHDGVWYNVSTGQEAPACIRL